MDEVMDPWESQMDPWESQGPTFTPKKWPALLRDYEAHQESPKALLRHYFLGGVALGGYLEIPMRVD